jgi:serine/threonine protein kinase/tetratricopeptide (TPR) repeat protein
MIGQIISHYKILQKIGSGGMGEVFLAEDSRLGRKVALKFLPPELSRDPEAKARFIHEARAASALDHPNICTVHDIGEDAEGRMFMVMPHYEGATLKEIMARGGITEAIPTAGASAGTRPHAGTGCALPLPIHDAMAIAAQIAEGLVAAHAKGIVHRDIKPANIFVTKNNTVKILDFGIAKLAGSQTKLTKTGSTVGTVAYMSPEQAMGKEVDRRTDNWSLGVILYEMLTGTLPFKGEYDQAMLYAVINEEPEPLAQARKDIPPGLERVVGQALAKESNDRYQSINDLLGDLKAVAAGSAAIKARPKRSSIMKFVKRTASVSVTAALLTLILGLDIGGVRAWLFGPGKSRQQAVRLAVLPFANLSGDPQQEYFSDGLTQEMITQLGKLHPQSLSVIARTSVMRYKKSILPVDRIGRELDVDYVLEGGVQHEANRVRVTVELIKVQGQSQLWADSFEREMAGILTIQNNVVQKVAGALAIRLLPSEQKKLASAHSVIPEAYDAFLKGMYHWQKMTPEDSDIAQRYFEMALAKDAAYAPAHAGLSWVWGTRQQMGMITPAEAGPEAKAAALTAIALDDRSVEAHEALAMVKTWTDWDWAGAAPEWRRALELNPNAANAHAYYAHYLAILGRLDEAVAHGERAIELDPFNALFHGMHALVLYFARRFDDSMAAARKAMALQPGKGVSAVQYIHISKGMREEQLAAQRQRVAQDPERVAALEQGLAECGYTCAQRRIADLLAARYENAGGVPSIQAERIYMPCYIALRYIDAGDFNRAVVWLEEAYRVRDPNLPYYTCLPICDPLRSDPRFQPLLKRIGLPGSKTR